MKVALLLSIALLFACSIFAEPFHYQNVLQGEAGAGMGGAFTALANDSSACIYNPAGLAQIKTTTFSLSANAIELSSYSILDYLPEGREIRSVTTTFYPTSWSIVKKLGKHALGFSLIVRDNADQSLNLKDTIKIASDQNITELNIIYDVLNQSREYLIGPTYAYPVTQKLFLGLSIFFFYKKSINNNFLYIQDNTNGRNFGFSTFNTEKSVGLSANVGIFSQLSERFSLGINLRSGGVFRDTAKVSRVEYDYFNNGTANIQVIPTNEATFKYGEPPGITIGLGYKDEKWRADFDYTHIVKIDALIPVENISIGAERTFFGKIPLRFGYFTNNTSLPSHKVNNTPEPDRFNIYGITLGVGYITDHTSTSLTFIIKGGSGKHKEITESDPLFYDVRTGGLIINFGGSYWF